MDRVDDIRPRVPGALAPQGVQDGQDRLSLRDIDEGSVRDLRAAVDDGLADQRRVERRLVEVGRVGDVYEVARRDGDDRTGGPEQTDGDEKDHDGKDKEKGCKKIESTLFIALALQQVQFSQQELVASSEQIAEENRERDIVSTRVVGDRVVFDTAAGPAHSVTLNSADLERMERYVASPVSGKTND